MRLMYEAEQSFSKKVRVAQWLEFCERAGWQRLRQIQRMRSALSARSPWVADSEPQETFRPSKPNYLYILAGETAKGDYHNYELFLNCLGLEPTSDTIEATAEQLRITFEPHGNNRREWWRDPSQEAREWLKRKITRKPHSDGFIKLDPSLVEPKDQHADKRKVLDADLREFMLREAVYAALPHRQAEVVWLYLKFHDDARPRETTGLIAEALGISPATVRGHKAEAAKNPQLRRALGKW
jgi:hypothetical protein